MNDSSAVLEGPVHVAQIARAVLVLWENRERVLACPRFTSAAEPWYPSNKPELRWLKIVSSRFPLRFTRRSPYRIPTKIRFLEGNMANARTALVMALTEG